MSIDDIANEQVPENQGHDPGRRRALKFLAGALGVASAYPAMKTAKKFLGYDNNAYAGGDPRDKQLREWMNQPVEETLKGTDYTPVNDHNYDKEVYQEHLPEYERQPTMVLFYNNHGVNSSQGLAALTRELHEQFPEIKLCAYKLSDGQRTPDDVLVNIGEKYPIEETPALLFYEKNDEGEIKYYEPISMMGGIETLDFMKKYLPVYEEKIPNEILNK